MVLVQLDIQAKNKLWCILLPHTDINTKWTVDVNGKLKALKFLGENLFVTLD